ncbi:16S rRNA (adenine(1518)-N(6)/adenine(1519)-N(6))-dimethyltransferase RsmA [Helicovermis profundi]|uniref:Ribosomal RNA small subunit methyltransferase A n=1 Tax=Helicovermis profundi TaxID=3065157 RepID=A0AAU9E7K8_9FIRM|nr:16S rRNA (adenine(1518)-N(6)/adenine(1519)-N(6)) -dimethyltransferase RsmA [Clostridia bacterium S502]
MRLTSPSTIKYIMEKYNFRFSKRLGQNFLIDNTTVENIINGSGITNNDNVIEIGPGIGVMTYDMAKIANKIVAIEIDNSLLPVLGETLEEFENIKIINGDVLKLDINKIIEEEFGGKFPKVIANLPYYITTPIIMKLLEENANVTDIIVMVQKEVAERIVSKPSKKSYGVLSVAVQYYAKASTVMKVPRSVFMPQPSVESTVIHLKIRENPPVKLLSKPFFFRVVRAAFAMRRKTLLNTISGGNLGINKEQTKELLSNSNIDSIRRGETLSIDEFALLSNNIYKFVNDVEN